MAEQPAAEWRAPKTFYPGVDGPVIRPVQPLTLMTPKRTLRDAVEQYFRDHRTSYLVFDESKRRLFTSRKLGAFHFMAYPKNGPNWLVWAARMRVQARDDMTAWEKVFGEEFVAVVASEKQTGELEFRTLSGEMAEVA
jgi:hypothetical protein